MAVMQKSNRGLHVYMSVKGPKTQTVLKKTNLATVIKMNPKPAKRLKESADKSNFLPEIESDYQYFWVLSRYAYGWKLILGC